MDHTGPEGQGPRTGRNLGRCAKKDGETPSGKIGEGMGKRRKGDCGEGKGKRLRSNMP
ncbi:DUF5320 domain-containing protein [Marinilabilia salmonicolor]|uniref:DUF5320 domain-containing protein n=1 Tax=Marinilabilia salmonicolor TaxID=989 RepID=UPI0002E43748|nr:DUF5320 domain-containing protein [Marinilabilia salmonicolor]